MKSKLYALVNCVDGGSVVSVSLASNDGICIRDNLPALKRLFPYVLEDMKFFEVGEVSDGGSVVSCEPREVSWDSYKFPENQVTPLTEEQKNQLRKQ